MSGLTLGIVIFGGFFVGVFLLLELIHKLLLLFRR